MKNINNYHRPLKLTEDYSPKVDFSKWISGEWEWHNFKTLRLEQLNNPKLVEFLFSHKLTSNWIQVFHTAPNTDSLIHSDNNNYDNWAKIIFQYGAKGSTMRWWTSEKFINHDTGYGEILISKPEDSLLEYEIEIGTSSLVNVGPLHSSHNPTSEPRFSITLALFYLDKTRVLWDDALEILSNYIKD
jgi:hypothetical protein